jgi:hypothetical protein
MSTLHVENLKGLSSGGNANKIIVPSGQTIDVSAGTLTPGVGQVVQETFTKGNNNVTSSGSAWVNSVVVGSITPKFSNSIIRLFATVAVWRSSGGAYFGVRIVCSGGNTNTVATWGDGYYTGGGGITWDTPYQCEFVGGSTNAITCTFQFNPAGHGMWFPNDGSTHSPDHRWTVKLTEIKQ